LELTGQGSDFFREPYDFGLIGRNRLLKGLQLIRSSLLGGLQVIRRAATLMAISQSWTILADQLERLADITKDESK